MMPILHTSPPPTPITVGDDSDDNPVKNKFHSMVSYDGNVMLAAAVVSLLLIILFVLLLHLYAKWFLTQARHRSGGGSVSVPQVFRAGAGRFSPHIQAFRVEVEVEPTFFPNSPAKKKLGLAQSVISSFPLFAYKGIMGKENNNGLLECSICLSGFEEGDMGRKLPRCRHAFHAECIDTWLCSHSSCPICRAPVTPCECTNGGGGTTPFEVTVEVPNEENIVTDDRSERLSGIGAGDL